MVDAGTKKCLVVVTPTEVQPKMTVSGEYPTSKFLAGRDLDVAFLVYHLEISDKALF